MKIEDFKVREVLILTKRHLSGIKKYTVTVEAINHNSNGMVTYSGEKSGQGAFFPENIGTTLFGLKAVEKTGKFSPAFKGFSPRPGDTGHDLMC